MATMNIEMIEEGVVAEENNIYNHAQNENLSEFDHELQLNPKKSLFAKWGRLLLYCTFSAVGTIGGPLLLRLYFLHGGNRKWISSGLQTAGFPILLIPLGFLYYKRDQTPGSPNFFASPNLLISGILLGLLLGVNNFMYSYGLSFLPVSTSSILISTQLVFTALFAFIMVKQKFTSFSINAIVVMTLGSVLLGIGKSSDRPQGVTSSQYLLGFILTLGAAGAGGFILPCAEVAYAKASKFLTYSIVLQFQFCMVFSATVFCIIGMSVNKDFSAMTREANESDLGATKYYLVLVFSAIVWQLMYIGTLGIIFCTTSLFAGVIGAVLLPMTEIAAVIIFHEKFTGEKGMALALGVWGFTSYFYGTYKESKKVSPGPDPTSVLHVHPHAQC